MSGLEIAGVVLGAFPILLSALEGYRKLARTAGLWFNIREEHQKCKNEVNAQRVAFTVNLKRLLLPLDINDTEMSRLLNAPGGEEWNDATITLKLQEHLRESYSVFMETAENMRNVAEELKEEMAVDKGRLQQKIQQTKSPELATRLKEALSKPNATREFYLYRLQFGLGDSVRKRLFDEMQRCNERLQNLLETSDAVSQAQSTRESAKQSLIRSALSGFWKQADQLYKVLSEAWNCSCWSQHHAHMLLQDRVSAEAHFQLMFWSNPHPLPVRGNSSWFCRPARVEIRKTPEDVLPIRLVPQHRPVPTARVTTPPKSSLASGKQSGSQHKMSRKADSILPRAPTVTITFIQENSSPKPKPETFFCSVKEEASLISSLCASFHQDITQAACHGYLQAHDKRYYIYQDDAASKCVLNLSNASTITLESVLHGNGTHPPLTRRQRYSLAVTLASSFLQLSGTPWINTRWTKSDIIFFQDPQDPVVLIPELPFVYRNFQTTAESVPAQNPPPAYPTTQSQNVEDTIRGFESLGIVLLELCFGTPIEWHPLCQQSGSLLPSLSPGVLRGALLLVALEWLRDVTGEAGTEYAEAVAWCLVGSRTTPPSGDRWRGDMLERVVRPLELCCSYIGATPGAQLI